MSAGLGKTKLRNIHPKPRITTSRGEPTLTPDSVTPSSYATLAYDWSTGAILGL